MTAPAALPLPGLPQAATPAAPGQDKAKIRQVARQFEAIFVRQMLAEARKTSLDDSDGGGVFGKQDQTFREMQDARFAEIAASKGAFGLANLIEKQLLARSGASAAAAPAAKTGG